MNLRPWIIEITTTCLVFSVISYGLGLAVKKEKMWSQTAAGFLFLGFGGITLALLLRGMSGDWTPWANPYGSYLLLSWMILLACWGGTRQMRTVLPGIMAAMIGGFLLAYMQWLEDERGPWVPALGSYWFHIHGVLKIASQATLVSSFISGILHVASKRGIWPEAVVNTDQWALITYKTMAVGFILLTLSMAAGVVWAYETTESYLGLGRREDWILVAWGIYAVYFHWTVRRKCGFNEAVWPAMMGFCCLAVSL